MNVPVWQHVLVILTLLGLHGATAFWAVRRIRELREALEARDTLLGVEKTPAQIARERMDMR